MNRLTFLGTAGSRYMMITQQRHTGGLWFEEPGGQWSIDPGPGALIRAIEHGKDPKNLKGFLITHQHLDHVGDLDVMIESATVGGRGPMAKKLLLATSPLVKDEPLIRPYLRPQIKTLHQWPQQLNLPNGTIKAFELTHGVPSFALRFDGFNRPSWGLLSDGLFDPKAACFFRGCDTLIANTTLLYSHKGPLHISTQQVPQIIELSQVRRLILTHLGTEIDAYPAPQLAAQLTTPDCQVIAAEDGMELLL